MSDYMRVTFEVKYYIKELKMKNTKYICDFLEDLNFSFSIIDHGGF